MLPTKCEMPEWSADHIRLRPLFLLIALAFNGPEAEFNLLCRLFVQWVDRAIGEYCEAREKLLAQIEEMNRTAEEMEQTGRIIYIFDFSDHIENCIVLTRRSYRALERLKTLPHASIDRNTRRYIEAQFDDIRYVRNYFEHVVEIATGGELPLQGSLFAVLSEDQTGIEAGGYKVSFMQLFNTLHRFHAVALKLIDIYSGESKASL